MSLFKASPKNNPPTPMSFAEKCYRYKIYVKTWFAEFYPMTKDVVTVSVNAVAFSSLSVKDGLANPNVSNSEALWDGGSNVVNSACGNTAAKIDLANKALPHRVDDTQETIKRRSKISLAIAENKIKKTALSFSPIKKHRTTPLQTEHQPETSADEKSTGLMSQSLLS